MKIIGNQKGFTLIELVLVIVVLGILAGFATIQFGTIVKDAKKAALDGAKSPYVAQLALAINTLKAVPTENQFKVEVFDKVTHDGDIHTGDYRGGKFRLHTGLERPCKKGNFRTDGDYDGNTGSLTFSPKEECGGVGAAP